MHFPSPAHRARWFVYDFFISQQRPPNLADLAAGLTLTTTQAELMLRRLHDRHWLFIKNDEIIMANPLSAVPTPYRVTVDSKSYWANCAWDMLGVPAMLAADAVIDATYEFTGEKTVMKIDNGHLKSAPNDVVHFLLPAKQWYDDLVYT